ncbi:hypothetical protein KVF89_22655 [Nocardioides carbamazepini]|uniref:hypothetical protein n=1 Tax=Nocardioides carbamazepini TaxID=2854259 RepID=UPI00214A12B4|nr:hypothetical protein [Nocardioides carbamazepini]MCR1785359.1 hypothetical protein [Nocardioides carbamazepini]
MSRVDQMTCRLAASRLSQATNPRHRQAAVNDRFARFAAEVAQEAGVDVLNDIVKTVRQHADLTRGRAAS